MSTIDDKDNRLVPPEATNAAQRPTLRKWYLDCVSDSGDVFIAYVAEVHLVGLALQYTSTLVQREGRSTAVRSSLRSSPLPCLEAASLSWAAEALGVSARLSAMDGAQSRTVLDRVDGRVQWVCHMPRARAEVEFASEPPIRGLGYVEELTLTLPPWRLPIDSLRWGRFLSEGASLVWIDWKGSHEAQVALLGSAPPLGAIRFRDDGLEVADPSRGEQGTVGLDLSNHRVLRDGVLGRTVLSILPAFDTILPARILFTEERKWVSRGVLSRGTERHEGWVIHEVVRWP